MIVFCLFFSDSIEDRRDCILSIKTHFYEKFKRLWKKFYLILEKLCIFFFFFESLQHTFLSSIILTAQITHVMRRYYKNDIVMTSQ